MFKDKALDEDIVDKIFFKIIWLENTNIRTKKLSYTEMVNRIKAIIEEEVECLLNQ